jgi:hypothetical protein
MPMVRLYEMGKDLPGDYLLAIGRVVVSFARLEGCVKLAIKNLSVALKISSSFLEGLQQAEEKYTFAAMVEHLEKLYRCRFPNDTSNEIEQLIMHLKYLADHRNRMVHSQWAMDGTEVIILSSKFTKKGGLRSNRFVVPLPTIHELNRQLGEAWKVLNVIRQKWV